MGFLLVFGRQKRTRRIRWCADRRTSRRRCRRARERQCWFGFGFVIFCLRCGHLGRRDDDVGLLCTFLAGDLDVDARRYRRRRDVERLCRQRTGRTTRRGIFCEKALGDIRPVREKPSQGGGRAAGLIPTVGKQLARCRDRHPEALDAVALLRRRPQAKQGVAEDARHLVDRDGVLREKRELREASCEVEEEVEVLCRQELQNELRRLDSLLEGSGRVETSSGKKTPQFVVQKRDRQGLQILLQAVKVRKRAISM